jgi:hypothetical protein
MCSIPLVLGNIMTSIIKIRNPFVFSGGGGGGGAAAAAISSVHIGVVIVVLLQVVLPIVFCFSTTTTTTTPTTRWSRGDSRKLIFVDGRLCLWKNRNPPFKMSFSHLQRSSLTEAEEAKQDDDNNINKNNNIWNVSVLLLDVDDTLDSILTLTELERNTTSNSNNNSNTSLFPLPELSPYYHRDPEDPLYKPIAHPEQISTLLRQRYYARQTKQYSQVAQLDRILQTSHGVFCYDGVYPNVIGLWTRRRRPPPQYQQRCVNKKNTPNRPFHGKQRQDQQQPQQGPKPKDISHSFNVIDYVDNCYYTLDSVTSRHLSKSDVQQMVQTYQQRCIDGDYESARLLQYQAKLQGIFLQSSLSSSSSSPNNRSL